MHKKEIPFRINPGKENRNKRNKKNKKHRPLIRRTLNEKQALDVSKKPSVKITKDVIIKHLKTIHLEKKA